MTNIPLVGSFRQATASSMRVRANDPASSFDLGRFADYRVTGAGKGALAPVSSIQLAIVRAPDKGATFSLFEEQKGFWQSRYADSRATNVGKKTVLGFSRENHMPLALLLGEPLPLAPEESNRFAVLVKDSPLLKFMFAFKEGALHLTSAGYLTGFPVNSGFILAREFNANVPSSYDIALGYTPTDALKETMQSSGISRFLVHDKNQLGYFDIETGGIKPLSEERKVEPDCGLVLIGSF